MKETFKDDTDFFKSHEVDDRGRLHKAIPTVEKKTKTIKVTEPVKEKKPPKEVVKYVEKIENACKVISEVVKDLAEADLYDHQSDDFVKMMAGYKEFKNKFRYLINDCINYPKTKTEDKPKSDFDKTRVRI